MTARLTPSAPDFGPRYRSVRPLGQGSQGDVYRAIDAVRGREVAIKTLRVVDAARSYALKQEFRLFAELSHPNLVALHELVADEGRAFFTSELIDGVSLAEAFRRAGPERFDALRGWTAGVLEGLAHLAARGLAHRDVKPTNVLADGERAVLLDFGLSSRVGEREGAQRVSGTLEYMAPEAILGAPASSCADLYALGTVLYELVAGRLPFAGDARAIVHAKCMGSRPRPFEGEGLPQDLCALALACLDPSPPARPSFDEARRAIGVAPSRAEITPPFHGRDAELATLRDALDEVTKTGAVIALEGPSGIGKSELMRRFCRAARDRALVLAGRCGPREHVRFKALDEIMEELAEYLVLRGEGAEALRPRDAEALERAFPALSRVPWTRTRERRGPPPTLAGMSLLAERALRELFTELACEAPIVVWIDDLQWSDADSRPFVEALAEVAASAPILLIGSYVSGAEPGLGDAPRTMRIGPLRPEDARHIVAPEGGVAPAGIERTIDEAKGNPHLLAELRASLADAELEWTPADGLDALLAQRLRALTGDERRVLDVAALAGARLSASALGRAAGVEREAYDAADRLVRRRLLRREPGAASELFEPFHARLREAALAELDAVARRALHERLAGVLADDAADPSLVATQFAAAERFELAAPHATRAADAAYDALAFDRAAHFCGIALRAEGLAAPDRAKLLKQKGLALAWSGRTSAGSEDLLHAAELLSGAEAIDALSTAAELLIGAGHRDDGVAILRRALDRVGIPLALAPWRRLLDAVWQRAALSFVRLERDPDPAEPSADDALKIALAWRSGLVLTIYDPAAALGLQGRHTRMAFSAGDPDAITRGRALEVVTLASMRKDDARVARLEAMVRDARARMAPGAVRADVDLLLGLADGYRGRFPESFAQLDAAAEDYGEGKLSRWQLNYTRAHRCLVLEFLGDYSVLAERVEQLADELARGDDRLGRAFLDVGAGYVCELMVDDAGGAEARVHAALAPFARELPVALQWLEVRARAKIALYRGDAAGARAVLERAARTLRALWRFQNVRIEHARLSAAAALMLGDRAWAEHAHEALARDADGWATPGLPDLIRGRLRRDRAALWRAAERFDAASLRGFAGAARAYAGDGELQGFARPDRWLRTFAG